MTTPTPDAGQYEPSYPRITLMASDGIDSTGQPIRWSVGDVHPFVSKMRIVAMYLNENVVEVYSFDGKTGIRELVPIHRTRLVREEMPPEVFKEELKHAELGYPDGDDDDDDEEVEGAETIPPPAPVPPNGQPES